MTFYMSVCVYVFSIYKRKHKQTYMCARIICTCMHPHILHHLWNLVAYNVVATPATLAQQSIYSAGITCKKIHARVFQVCSLITERTALLYTTFQSSFHNANYSKYQAS